MGEFIPSEELYRTRTPGVAERLADILGYKGRGSDRTRRLDDHMLRDIGLDRAEVDRATGTRER